jgi:ribonuclease Y
MNTLGTFIVIILSLVVGSAAGYYGRRLIAESRIRGAEEEAVRIIEEASKEAEAKKKETLLEAKEEIHRNRQEAEKDMRDRRRELDRIERRILQKEKLWIRKLIVMRKKNKPFMIAKKKWTRHSRICSLS